MKLRSAHQECVRCAAAIDLGFPSMAAAAALGFELIQRVWDVFGIPDPDVSGVESETRGIQWEDYRPGVVESVVSRG